MNYFDGMVSNSFWNKFIKILKTSIVLTLIYNILHATVVITIFMKLFYQTFIVYFAFITVRAIASVINKK
jgi:hypothetical protein